MNTPTIWVNPGQPVPTDEEHLRALRALPHYRPGLEGHCARCQQGPNPPMYCFHGAVVSHAPILSPDTALATEPGPKDDSEVAA